MRQEGSMYEIESTEYQDPQTGTRYRVRIMSDDDATSPRDADNPTVMHTFDRDYYSPEDITQKRVWDSIFPAEYDTWHSPGAFDLRRARKYAALDPNILAVRGLDRYGDELRLSDDDETAGYIAITRESWQRTWMGEADRKPAEAMAEVMRQEVDAYNRWARGEYVGVIVEQLTTWTPVDDDDYRTMDIWEEVDSLWGVDGIEYARGEALAMLPDNIEEV